jgi:membrane-bound lytic murein transglycosylase D
MRGRRFFAVLVVSGLVAVHDPASAAGGKPQFPRYPQLEPNVAFWRDVFAKYTTRQIVFHDPYHLDVVYYVADVSDLMHGDGTDRKSQRAVRSYIASQTARIASILRSLAHNPPRTEEERQIAASLASARGDLPSNGTLAGRIRTQRGLGDELCSTMERARQWLPEMKQILAENGVPVDLASLPLVESGFRTSAHSFVGAAGVWQFTRTTGRRYMRIDRAIDERRDPLAATEGAARYLRSNYEQLGTWPLAITAYNHGEGGVAAAVRKLGTTDLGKIVERYEGRAFGFASRNFYAEFLAARDVMSDAARYCGPAAGLRRKLESAEVKAYVPFAHLARCAGVDNETLAELNPALQSDVVRGRMHVPRGYRLWLPSGTKAAFNSAYATLPSSVRYAAQTPTSRTHRVRSGQSLTQIAAMYGTSVSELREENGLRSSSILRAGALLKVPYGGPSATAAERRPLVAAPARKSTPTEADGTYVVHQVSRGQTLSQIAQKYGTTVASLRDANGLATDGTDLRVGERIKVPRTTTAARASYRTHKVGRGQTLSQIADLYRTTVATLQKVNGISDPRDLRHGQVLRVPM